MSDAQQLYFELITLRPKPLLPGEPELVVDGCWQCAASGDWYAPEPDRTLTPTELADAKWFVDRWCRWVLRQFTRRGLPGVESVTIGELDDVMHEKFTRTDTDLFNVAIAAAKELNDG